MAAATATGGRRAGDGQSMAARGGALAAKAGDTWSAFSLPQKVITGLLAIGLVVGAVMLSRVVSEPKMSPLYSNLSGEDAQAIVDQLTAAGVQYELTDGGATILVPQETVYDQRIAAASNGLPSSSQSGYSLLDEQGITSSQFQQQVAYQRALEGELATTIGHIDGVNTAVVHLAIPQKDVFLQETDQPTASVLVETRPGQQLSDDQVRAIVNLVSSSVEGLPSESVTVVDGDGNLLSAPGVADVAAGAGADATEQYEAGLTADLQRLLDTVLGPGNAVASVTAQLDFDENEATTERFINEEGVPPLTETSKVEEFAGAGAAAPGGVLGPDNNGIDTGDGQSQYNNEERTVTNAVGKVTERTTAAPGAVERLSVSVVVDTETAGNVDLGELENSVVAAAGIDPARGDAVAISRLPFDKAAAEEAQAELDAAAGAQARNQLFGWVRTGVLALLVIGVLVFTLIAAKRRKPTVDVLDIAALDDDDARMAALEGELDQTRRALVLQQQQRERRSLEAAERQTQVTDLVERQPDEVADLLRTWLADRRG